MDEIKIIKKDKSITIQPKINIYEVNRKIADENLQKFKENNVISIDIMGAIGAGKTTILEKIVEKIKDRYNVVMIGGDIATTIDTERINRFGIEVYQINAGCHLDAPLIKKTIKNINLADTDILLVENVGNLICPAEYVLGTDMRVCVVSVTEGPYMVMKHPIIIGHSDIVVINKIEMAELMEVDLEKLQEDVRKINPRTKIVLTSARKGKGIDELITELGFD